MVTRIVFIGAAACLLAGCGGGSEASVTPGGEERVAVVAAFYPLAYAAERVGGEAVEVTNLTPPGAEPHDVELSARDVERIRSAELVLYLGGGFQPALERTLPGAEGRSVDLLEGPDLRHGGGHAHEDEDEDEHGREDEPAEGEVVDPHVWLDPLRYAAIVKRIGTELAAEDEAAALVAELEELDAEYERGLADCTRRELVASHAAFGYLAERYGLVQIALTGISPEAEPSARDLERLVDEVREHRATTVFFETLVSPRLAETVAREVGARTAVLNPLEGLTRDEQAQGATYFSVMRANLSALREGLGCR